MAQCSDRAISGGLGDEQRVRDPTRSKPLLEERYPGQAVAGAEVHVAALTFSGNLYRGIDYRIRRRDVLAPGKGPAQPVKELEGGIQKERGGDVTVPLRGEQDQSLLTGRYGSYCVIRVLPAAPGVGCDAEDRQKRRDIAPVPLPHFDAGTCGGPKLAPHALARPLTTDRKLEDVRRIRTGWMT
jgi:hypothetical protein